jgi:hypothetical protein
MNTDIEEDVEKSAISGCGCYIPGKYRTIEIRYPVQNNLRRDRLFVDTIIGVIRIFFELEQ